MSFRLPQNLSNGLELSDQENALAYEINQEKAYTLGNLGRQLVRTLEKLAANEDDTKTSALEANAAIALYNLVVFREANGLSGTQSMMDSYNVPPKIRALMGPDPNKAR